MSEQKFVKGILIGAAVGGLVTLLDHETRKTVWRHVQTTQKNTRRYLQNPTESFHDLCLFYEDTSTRITSNLGTASKWMAQLQNVLDTVSQIEQSSKSITSTK